VHLPCRTASPEAREVGTVAIEKPGNRGLDGRRDDRRKKRDQTEKRDQKKKNPAEAAGFSHTDLR
jgi:hypothetical protein